MVGKKPFKIGLIPGQLKGINSNTSKNVKALLLKEGKLCSEATVSKLDTYTHFQYYFVIHQLYELYLRGPLNLLKFSNDVQHVKMKQNYVVISLDGCLYIII